jgi:DNA polymerase III alpha subunit
VEQTTKMKTDQYHRRVFNEREICDILYQSPDADLTDYNLDNPDQYNFAVKTNYSDLNSIERLPDIDVLPEVWHRRNQQTWLMPDTYQQFDIAQWVLAQCVGEAEIQRAGTELLIYAERNLLDMLCYLKYLVDTMRENSIVWGVGRGSSVASFVLYKIGVHRIDSLYYDLDFKEFMR